MANNTYKIVARLFLLDRIPFILLLPLLIGDISDKKPNIRRNS